MMKNNSAAFIRSDIESKNASRNYRIISLLFIVFVISLPFTGWEWRLIFIPELYYRFELKMTMLYFGLLFIAWLWNSLEFPRKRSKKEKLFYTFAIMYGASQFISLINSPIPVETIKQAIIMACLLIMMIVISETVLDRKMARRIMTSMGIWSLIIGIWAVINYYFIGRYFTDAYYRIGWEGTAFPINIGGDAPYFGDILLYSLGAVFFAALNLYRKKYWGWLSWPLLMLWFSAMILTYTKGLYGAVICFFFCAFLILKKNRFFVIIGISAFITAAVLNIEGPRYYIAMKSKMEERIEKKIFAETKKAKPEFQKDVLKNRKDTSRLWEEVPQIDNIELRSEIEKRAKKKAQVESYMSDREFNLSRLSLVSHLGSNSISVRIKSILVSLVNSVKHFWFGNGAGLSQSLLPEMANRFDASADGKMREFMKKYLVYGDANVSAIDAHNLFLVEFFHVGIVGVIFLVSFVIFVMREQIRAIKTFPGRDDNINELLFATLIAMVFYRMTETCLVIPFFWFMLGLCFGVSKLYRNGEPVR